MSNSYVTQDTPIYTATGRPLDALPQRVGDSNSGSGLATGIMVCGVFVVVAIMAATFYSPTDMSSAVVNSPDNSVVESDGTAVPTPAEATPAIEDPITPAPAAATAAPAEDAATAAPAADSQTAAPAADAQPAAPAADTQTTAPAATADPAATPAPVAPATGAAAPATQPQP